MLKNYIKIAYRSLLKNKVFSMINIVGFSIGITVVSLILLYVHYEFSFDRFHEKADHIYRVSLSNPHGESSSAIVQPALGPAVAESFPEVQSFARIYALNKQVLKWNDQTLRIEQLFCVDSSFLSIFTLEWVYGNPQQALSTSKSVVLSSSTAKQLFGNEHPIGKTIWRNQDESYVVSGVFKDLPSNAHFHPDALFSYEMLYNPGYPSWFKAKGWDFIGYHTYLLLNAQANPQAVSEKITSLAQSHLSEEFTDLNYQLLPLVDIHLNSHTPQELGVNGNAGWVYILLIVALLTLIIANINYINLSISRATERAKEVGIRKAIGAGREKIVFQFLCEYVLTGVIALGISLIFFQASVGPFIQMVNIPYSFIEENIIYLLSGMLVVVIFSTAMSGIYPSVILSSYEPLKVLKNNYFTQPQGAILRKGLIVFQFTVSLSLLLFTFTMQQQVAFMQHKDLGVNLEQTLVMKLPTGDTTLAQRAQYFKNELLELPSVLSLTSSTVIPGEKTKWEQDFEYASSDSKVRLGMFWIDDLYMQDYEINVVAGRNFSIRQDQSEKTILINKAAADILGYTEPEKAIGENITWLWKKEKLEIVGVIDNYHHLGLQEEVQPLIFVYRNNVMRYLSAKITTGDYQATLATIEDLWKSTFPETPLDFFFLDDFFQAQYKHDLRLKRIMELFSGFALFIACLGMFGLSSISISQRTKEIGIRKVMGASVQSIVALLSKSFIKLVVIAGFLALPLAYLVMQKWLENYAFKIEISWWLLGLPVVMVLLIALITVSFQTIRAALANPVDSLRYE